MNVLQRLSAQMRSLVKSPFRLNSKGVFLSNAVSEVLVVGRFSLTDIGFLSKVLID